MKHLKSKSLIALVLIGLLGLGVWILVQRPTGSPQSVRFGKVKKGDLVQRVTVSGQVQPLKRTVFTPPFTGYIHKIFVTVGQKVAKGDPVISVAASLSGAEPIYPIRAPFAGTVVGVHKTEGEFVVEKQEKDSMVRIDNLDKFFVVAKAAELDAARIKNGMEVEIRVNAIGKSDLKGIVRNIDLAAQDADGWKQQQSTFDVRAEVVAPPEDLRSGQSAILDIVTDRFQNVLYLEHEFINKEADQYFIITREGKRKNITLGRQSDMAAEIVSGLREGEEVQQVDFLKVFESGL